MPFSRKLLAFTIYAALGVAVALAEKKEKPKADAKPAAAAGKKTEQKSGGESKEKEKKNDEKAAPKLSLPLPKGQDSKGVVIPYTDAAGKKSMVFKIGVGTRLDDNRVKMTDLLIETFDENNTQEMTIALPASQLDLSTRTITGDQGVTIKRSDFEITGKNMEFNTETKQGRIKGNVRMIIYELTEEIGAEAPAKPATQGEEQGS
jgi:hypothetical protein